MRAEHTQVETSTRTTWVWNQAKPQASQLSLFSVGRYDIYTSNITLASGRTIPEWTFIDPGDLRGQPDHHPLQPCAAEGGPRLL